MEIQSNASELFKIVFYKHIFCTYFIQVFFNKNIFFTVTVPPKNDEKSNTGAIIGGVVGLLFLIAIIAAIALFLSR